MNGAPGSSRSRTTLSYLRRRISSGDWPVNSRIPTENELMQLLGVGKATVRDAVRSLASVGMLEPLPGRGTFVRSRTPVSAVLTDYISDYGLAEALIFRRALEIEAAQQAARHRTGEQLDALRTAHERLARDVDYPGRFDGGRTPGQFHAVLFEATGSELLPALYAGIMASVRRAIDRGEVVYRASAELRHTDHTAILRAIETRDTAAAGLAMTAHVDRDLVARGAEAVAASTGTP